MLAYLRSRGDVDELTVSAVIPVYRHKLCQTSAKSKERKTRRETECPRTSFCNHSTRECNTASGMTSFISIVADLAGSLAPPHHLRSAPACVASQAGITAAQRINAAGENHRAAIQREVGAMHNGEGKTYLASQAGNPDADGGTELSGARINFLAGDIDEQLRAFRADPPVLRETAHEGASDGAFYDVVGSVTVNLQHEGRFEEAAEAYERGLAIGEEAFNNSMAWEEALITFLASVQAPRVVPENSLDDDPQFIEVSSESSLQFVEGPEVPSVDLALSRPEAPRPEEALESERTCAICLETSPPSASQHAWFTCVPRPKEGSEGSGWTGCCGTHVCPDCMTHYLRQKIMEGDTALRCPGQCRRDLGEAEVRQHVPSMCQRVDKLRRLRNNPNLRECPSCGCLNEGSRRRPDMACVSCQTSFCFHHALAHPGQTCRQYNRTNRLPLASGSVSGFHVRTRLKVCLTTQACPRCHARVQRNGGCAHMTCRCGAHFCWHCGKETRGGDGHYNLWGACRSSVMRGKRLGVVLGAPVALATVPIWGPALCCFLARNYDSD